MKPPDEPSKEDCCNSGCNPCIFDVYDKHLKLYKKYLETGEFATNEQNENAISQLDYTSFVLIQNIEICESHKLLSFRKSNLNNRRVWWKPGDHLLLKYQSGGKSCTRAYTPIKWYRPNADYDFFIIVKLYDKGMVSSYLNNLIPGENTLWRGPYGSYELCPNKFKRIIMIAQGTGVAPFISIIQNILNDEDDMTRIVLYYCCHNVNQILLREELYSFKEYWNYTYKIFLSEISANCGYKYQEPLIENKLCVEDLHSLKPFSFNDQFLLCGSNQFIHHYDIYLKNEQIQNVIKF